MDGTLVTVTALFTDIEGSTRLWEEHPEAMRGALARHDELMREAIESHRGHVFKMVGDAFHAVFDSSVDAVEAAIAGQQMLESEPWPDNARIRVRMAVHSGELTARKGDYVGPMLNRLSRILGTAHGGQLVLSELVADQVRSELPDAVAFLDLGQHRLRDLALPERLFQVRAPGLADQFAPLRSLEDPGMPNNLPALVTSFVGRNRELVALRALVDESRVVTVTGAGGVGKTRLALQMGAQLLDGTGDGVWLVELAPLATPDLVAPTVAAALRVREEPGRSPLDTLVDALAERSVLIILDNCEHVLHAAAELAQRLLEACPCVEILATSREPLGISGERVYRIPSLSLPPAGAPRDVTTLAEYEAVQLFADRASHHQPSFAVDPANIDAVVSVCTHLDGIPLAIELAAARLRSLSIWEIEQRLDYRFQLLRGGSRTALPRHRTLDALVAWSYDLLPASEQSALSRLSVFAWGWDLDAAEVVIADGKLIEAWQVIDVLAALVDKSLVQAEPRGETTRYRLLETIREFAHTRLVETGALPEVERRHVDYFLALAETAEPELRGPRQSEWLNRLEAEHDNIRAALRRSLVDAGTESEQQRLVGLRLAGAMSRFWYVHGYPAEGRQWLVRAVDVAPASAHGGRAAALQGLGNLAYQQNDNDVAERALRESLALWRRVGDDHRTAETLKDLAMALWAKGDTLAARSMLEESIVALRELGEDRLLGAALNNLAVIDIRASEAIPLLEEALRLHTKLDDGWSAVADKSNLAVALIVAKRPGRAHELMVSLVDEIVALGDLEMLAGMLETFAIVATSLERHLDAARLAGAAARVRADADMPSSTEDLALLEELLGPSRNSLGSLEWDRAWNDGSGLDHDEAIEIARCLRTVGPTDVIQG